MMLLRQALRAIWARPQLSLVAVALLALGIGANTTLFALADAVMFRPFPFAEQDRLIIGGGVQAGRRAEIPYPDFIDWRTRAHSFDDLAAIASVELDGHAAGRRTRACCVSRGVRQLLRRARRAGGGRSRADNGR